MGLEINYKIQYRLPIITNLSEYLIKRGALKPLKLSNDANYSYRSQQEIQIDEREVQYKKFMTFNINPKKGTLASIEYDFSSITMNKLITVIKELSIPKSKQISISFGDSLRLLGVRSIICLMQCCFEKGIILNDIDLINWDQPFLNAVFNEDCNDPRLFSFTFDENRKSLLISLYLTGYGSQNNYNLLKQFVAKYDVPINIADDRGDTILHHMIRAADYDAIYELLNALKPNQRFQFDARNDDGNTVLHEMVKKNDYDELKHLLNIIDIKSEITRSLKVFNESGESPLYLALQNDRNRLKNKNADGLYNEQQQEFDDAANDKNEFNINLVIDFDE